MHSNILQFRFCYIMRIEVHVYNISTGAVTPTIDNDGFVIVLGEEWLPSRRCRETIVVWLLFRQMIGVCWRALRSLLHFRYWQKVGKVMNIIEEIVWKSYHFKKTISMNLKNNNIHRLSIIEKYLQITLHCYERLCKFYANQNRVHKIEPKFKPSNPNTSFTFCFRQHEYFMRTTIALISHRNIFMIETGRLLKTPAYNNTQIIAIMILFSDASSIGTNCCRHWCGIGGIGPINYMQMSISGFGTCRNECQMKCQTSLGFFVGNRTKNAALKSWIITIVLRLSLAFNGGNWM